MISCIRYTWFLLHSFTITSDMWMYNHVYYVYKIHWFTNQLKHGFCSLSAGYLRSGNHHLFFVAPSRACQKMETLGDLKHLLLVFFDLKLRSNCVMPVPVIASAVFKREWHVWVGTPCCRFGIIRNPLRSWCFEVVLPPVMWTLVYNTP